MCVCVCGKFFWPEVSYHIFPLFLPWKFWVPVVQDFSCGSVVTNFTTSLFFLWQLQDQFTYYSSKESLKHWASARTSHPSTHEIVTGNLQYVGTILGTEDTTRSHVIPALSLPTGNLHSSGLGLGRGRQCVCGVTNKQSNLKLCLHWRKQSAV